MLWFNGVKITVDKLPDLYLALRILADQRLLAGIPAERAERKDGAVTNATIGYVQEHGDPATGIPPRPFLYPAVRAMQEDIVRLLRMAGDAALRGDPVGTTRALNALGLMAQNRIRARINEGIPPPLARATLLARMRARTAIKGAKAELARRDAGFAAGMDLAKPLVATGQLRNSITYVIRSIGLGRVKFGRDLQIGSPGSQSKWYDKFTR